MEVMEKVDPKNLKRDGLTPVHVAAYSVGTSSTTLQSRSGSSTALGTSRTSWVSTPRQSDCAFFLARSLMHLAHKSSGSTLTKSARALEKECPSTTSDSSWLYLPRFASLYILILSMRVIQLQKNRSILNYRLCGISFLRARTTWDLQAYRYRTWLW